MTDGASADVLAAYYYDGRTARQHRVTLRLEAQSLLIEGADVERRERLADIRIAERYGSGPRLFQFGDGAYCEIHDHATLAAMMRDTGLTPRRIEAWQASWRVAAFALVGVALTAVLAWRFGLPVAARVIAGGLSPTVNEHLSETTLAAFDASWLTSSELDQARRDTLASGFAELDFELAGARPRLEFRHGGTLGANAFALPDGTLVLLDELVALSDDNDDIYAVLAHEVGHVEHQHGLRMLLQGSIVAVAMSAWLGDISSVLALLPTALLQTEYSRNFEAEADDYAVRELRRRGISTEHLANMLERLVKAHKADLDGSSLLSSHPAPAERIRRLREAGQDTIE